MIQIRYVYNFLQVQTDEIFVLNDLEFRWKGYVLFEMSNF